jgi:transposase-like protein
MAQRKALTQAERALVVKRHQAKATLAQIAGELGCSWHTVRKWWRHHRRGLPVRRHGRPAQGVLSTYPPELVMRAVDLKQTHPHWGPANVKVELRRDERFRQSPLPSNSRLAALFRERCPQAVQPHQHHPYPAPALPGVHQPHERWQMDGKENVPVGATQVATLLEVRDPASALMIASQAVLTTTAKGRRKLTRPETQEVLRGAFSHWGLPLEIQTDHEVTYTGAPDTDFPTSFTLWLVGLGVAHVTSRDRRPTDQAQVERNHRTLGDMGWKDQPSQTLAELQALVDERRTRYNQELPVWAADCQGQPPLVAHPTARHSGRPYLRALEWQLFDIQRVDRYLEKFVWPRLVTKGGTVSIANRPYLVGHSHQRKTISVRFLPETRAFRFELADGTFIKQLPAQGLEAAELIGFLPVDAGIFAPFQLPLALQGV